MTRNTEYHLQSGICVAVRDRASGNWQLCHGALGRHLVGSIRRKAGREPYPTVDKPEVGDSLFFTLRDREGPEVLTSNLLAIERPQKATVAAYPV
jgi:hypothetical protein